MAEALVVSSEEARRVRSNGTTPKFTTRAGAALEHDSQTPASCSEGLESSG
jgi:hypothetical protein